MQRFIETLIDGIATGSIYGALALALVLIYRSTGIVNFAQGEMAMFSTFIAWGLDRGRASPLGLAILLTLVVSLRRRDGDRARADPARSRARQELTLVTVTLGLFILVNGLARWIWGSTNRGFPSLFPDGSRRPSAASASSSSRSGWSPCCSASSACCG